MLYSLSRKFSQRHPRSPIHNIKLRHLTKRLIWQYKMCHVLQFTICCNVLKLDFEPSSQVFMKIELRIIMFICGPSERFQKTCKNVFDFNKCNLLTLERCCIVCLKSVAKGPREDILEVLGFSEIRLELSGRIWNFGHACRHNMLGTFRTFSLPTLNWFFWSLWLANT